MITCQYCNASYIEHQTICSSCGAVLDPKEGVITRKTNLEKIRQICESYEDAKDFHPGKFVSLKKMRVAAKSFTVFPKEKENFLFCDTHPLGKGKRGFIICDDGVYWQNTRAATTNRNYLAWEDLAKRELKLNKYVLELGRGDVIGLSGLGSDNYREKAERLFREIKAALND
ncbi:MAG: hypothetical protein GY755_09295 [Chloroflexi bacterium]|nr:hypothetical protein [Chloroflexota bacterium]